MIPENHCKFIGSYFLAFLRIYLYRYYSYCIYFWSGINEILVNYDRYLVLSNKSNFFNKKHSFKIIIFISAFVSFLAFVPNLFAFKISVYNQNETESNSYYVTKTKFGNTDLFQLYVLFVLAVSNILSTIFLILSSVKLFLEARHFRQNLTTLQNNTQNNQTANTREAIRRKQLEITIFKLVFIMSLLFVLVRLNDFGYTLNNSLILLNMADNYDFFVYYSNFWYILGVIVLNSNIFVLCVFNNKFRTVLFYYTKKTVIADSIANYVT